MSKSRLEKSRILLTWIAAASALLLFVTSENSWESRNKAIPVCLFSLGLVFVGLASLGRMCHVSHHQVVAMIESISPGNKASPNGLNASVRKAREALAVGVHLLLVDLSPARHAGTTR